MPWALNLSSVRFLPKNESEARASPDSGMSDRDARTPSRPYSFETIERWKGELGRLNVPHWVRPR
jgi:hypothetical protein